MQEDVSHRFESMVHLNSFRIQNRRLFFVQGELVELVVLQLVISIPTINNQWITIWWYFIIIINDFFRYPRGTRTQYHAFFWEKNYLLFILNIMNY